MLKEKIGQMLMMGFKGTVLSSDDVIVHAILARQIGGVILFGYNIEGPEQLKRLTQQLQNYAEKAGIAPLLISIDYEGGKVARLKQEAGFPATQSAEDIGKLTYEQAATCAQNMAITLKKAGINVNFAPVVDVNVNQDNPVIGKLKRSFSEDPKKVTDYAAIFHHAYQSQGIICAYKHFPGHGSSIYDTHKEFVDITETWQRYELAPYQQLIQQSHEPQMVMTSHVVHCGLDNKGYPASLSHAITTQLLRNELKFNGIIITDDLQMKAIVDHYGVDESTRLAINAGADILIFGNQLVSFPQSPSEIIELVHEDVTAQRIPQAQIEEAYRRIVKLKANLL